MAEGCGVLDSRRTILTPTEFTRPFSDPTIPTREDGPAGVQHSTSLRTILTPTEFTRPFSDPTIPTRGRSVTLTWNLSWNLESSGRARAATITLGRSGCSTSWNGR